MEDIRESPQDMMFTDNVVSYTEMREEAKKVLEKWRGVGNERNESQSKGDRIPMYKW